MKINKDSIHFHVLFNYVLLVIIPFVAIITIWLLYFQNYSRDTYGINTLKLMNSEQEQWEKISKTFIENSMFVYYNNNISKIENYKTQDGAVTIQAALDDEISLRSDISEIVLRVGDKVFFSGKNYGGITEKLDEFDELLETNGGRPIWLTTLSLLPRDHSGYKLVLGRSINSSTKKDIAKLYLIIDVSIMDKMIENMSTPNSVLYMINDRNIVMNSTDNTMIGKQLDLDDLKITTDNGYHFCEVDKKKSLVIYDRSKRTDWQIVDVIPTSEIQGRINIIRVLIGLVAVTYLLFLWIMLMLLSKGIVVPISKLADKMDKFSKGNMEIKADDSASGEIGKLNKHFNSMTQHISMLIKENEYETKQKNDFEMKALIAQLNPHFIYNALNTIKWMAVINNQSNIEKLTEALINVLMNSAQSGQEYHLVNDEIELIKSYVIIQKARFMNFSVEYDVTPESEQYVIRKFLIQPVVENSIIHGLLRGKVKNGLIKIRIWTDEYLNVEVSDNGCGFDTDILKDKKHSEDEGYTSLALANIMQIVDIDYGKPYKIEVISILGKGTKIVYLLPLIKKEKIDDKNNSC